MNMMVTQISLMNGEKEMVINNIEELFDYFKKNKISIYKSKKPGVLFLNGQYEELIKSTPGLHSHIEVWESHHDGKWMTFLKNPKKSIHIDKSDTSIEHLSDEKISKYYACDGFCTKGKPWESEVGWHKGEW